MSAAAEASDVRPEHAPQLHPRRWAALGVIAISPLVPESRSDGDTSYDVPGAIVVTLGLTSLVYGFPQAAKPDKAGTPAPPGSSSAPACCCW
jgi:hypothetical protein